MGGTDHQEDVGHFLISDIYFYRPATTQILSVGDWIYNTEIVLLCLVVELSAIRELGHALLRVNYCDCYYCNLM